VLEIVAAVAGIVIIIAIFWDAFETMVLSRRVLQTYRIARLYYRATWSTWSQLTQLVPDGTRREALLGLYGPLSLIILIALWAILLITGFGLLHYGLGSELESAAGEASLGTDLYFSGTTFVTLGLGDVNPQGDAARALTVLEAGTGFGFLALVIGYLPVLYQAFSRRDLVRRAPGESRIIPYPGALSFTTRTAVVAGHTDVYPRPFVSGRRLCSPFRARPGRTDLCYSASRGC
jgi:hypothetical protein